MSARKMIKIHRTVHDGGHWFYCGAGEEFLQAASAQDIYGQKLSSLLPLVETYARARAAEELREAAADITWTGTSTVRDLLHNRADNLIDPCRCPETHCGDCGCCTCLACGHTPENHDPDDGCGACAMAMRPFRHDYDPRTT